MGEHAAAIADLSGARAALVVGCGPVGLAVIAALKARGFGPVIAADFASGRRALAESFGADIVLDPSAGSPHRRWEDLGLPMTRADRGRILAAGGKPGRPVIFDCVGLPGIIQSIIEEAPAGAQIVVVGVCMEADRFEPSTAIAKELELRFAYAYSADEFAATLRNIAEGRIDAGLAVDPSRRPRRGGGGLRHARHARGAGQDHHRADAGVTGQSAAAARGGSAVGCKRPPGKGCAAAAARPASKSSDRNSASPLNFDEIGRSSSVPSAS